MLKVYEVTTVVVVFLYAFSKYTVATFVSSDLAPYVTFDVQTAFFTSVSVLATSYTALYDLRHKFDTDATGSIRKARANMITTPVPYPGVPSVSEVAENYNNLLDYALKSPVMYWQAKRGH